MILHLIECFRSIIHHIFQPQDNHVESIRLKTEEYELIVSQEGSYTLIFIQEDSTQIASKEITEQGVEDFD